MNPPKDIGIVATASLPWLTGGSIAPLFHGVFLNKLGYRTTLYLPWMPAWEQQRFMGCWPMRSPEDQQGYIRLWLPPDLRPFIPEIRFYPAWYQRQLMSVLPVRDPDTFVAGHDAVILEEPEHLFGTHPLSRFKQGRPRVIGVVMTHYLYYLTQHLPGFLIPVIRAFNLFLMKRLCHRIAAISPVEEKVCALPHCRVVPLNAVHPQFFGPHYPPKRNGVYFMGKLIPEKGLATLFRALEEAGIRTLDLFGDGDLAWVRSLAQAHGVAPVFRGLTNAPWRDAAPFRIFVNCSESEYLCTTTANALVMQQWVILPRHRSNTFFLGFKNCLAYDDFPGLVACLAHALTHDPVHDPDVAALSWEGAAQRLADLIEESGGS